MKKWRDLWTTYREQLLYLVFGGLTTLVDFGISFAGYRVGVLDVHAVNVIAWVAAVLFAYVTNRIWVFESPRHGALLVLCEFAAFAGGRVLTLLLQDVLFWIFYNRMGINQYLVKIGAAVLIVILNYVISKLLVFRKKN
jgi:putative flippase GtrA